MAIINYRAQVRPDLAVTARVLSQRMAIPTESAEHCLKRAFRNLVSHTQRVSMYPRVSVDDARRIWTDSDGIGNVSSPKSYSGGHIQRNGDDLSLE